MRKCEYNVTALILFFVMHLVTFCLKWVVASFIMSVSVLYHNNKACAWAHGDGDDELEMVN